MMPVYPWSVSLDQSTASYAASVSIRRRISALGHSPAKNLRALFFRNSWLSVKPNCMAYPLIASGQAQNEMSNDVSLYLGSAGFDSIPTGSQVPIRPNPVVDRPRVASQQLAVRTKQLLSDLLETLVELAPENFLDGSLRPRNTRGGDAAESTHLIEAHDLNFRAALRELLADEGIFGCGPPITLDSAREFDETRDEALEAKVQ